MKDHMSNAAIKDHVNAVAVRPRLLSLREAVVLAGVPEKEKWVRNDISHGFISSARVVRMDNAHLAFTWPFVISFAAAYGNAIFTEPNVRGLVFEKVFLAACGTLNDSVCTVAAIKLWSNSVCSKLICSETLDVDRYVSVNIGRACADVKPRIDLYAEGLGRVEEDPSVLGGAAVFTGTRLSVSHIGKMAERGVPLDEIVEDYPYLTEGDVEFAKLYFRARPPRGRPPVTKEDNDGERID